MQLPEGERLPLLAQQVNQITAGYIRMTLLSPCISICQIDPKTGNCWAVIAAARKLPDGRQ